MIQQGILLTNWHCGGVAPLAVKDYWNEVVIGDMFADISWDGDEISREYVGIKLLAGSEALDYALIQMKPLDPSDIVSPLPISTRDVVIGEPLFVIHHTEGLPKQVSTCKVDTLVSKGSQYAPGAEFEHSCDTEKGSSGGPVFDSAGLLVGIHHAGFALDNECRPLDKENKAVRLSVILADIKMRHPEVHLSSK